MCERDYILTWESKQPLTKPAVLKQIDGKKKKANKEGKTKSFILQLSVSCSETANSIIFVDSLQ